MTVELEYETGIFYWSMGLERGTGMTRLTLFPVTCLSAHQLSDYVMTIFYLRA